VTEVTRKILEEQAQWLERQLSTARDELALTQKDLGRRLALVSRLEQEIRDVRADLPTVAEVAS
jgi:DNA polymerase sigma